MDLSEISNKLIKKNSSKKRCRQVKDKIDISIKKCNKDLIIQPIVSPEGAISYMVKSESDSTKMYRVTGMMDGLNFNFNCNCGEQFGIKFRNNCKHILATIIYQMKNYIQTHFEDDKKKNSSVKEFEMIKMMENMTFLS